MSTEIRNTINQIHKLINKIDGCEEACHRRNTGNANSTVLYNELGLSTATTKMNICVQLLNNLAQEYHWFRENGELKIAGHLKEAVEQMHNVVNILDRYRIAGQDDY